MNWPYNIKIVALYQNMRQKLVYVKVEMKVSEPTHILDKHFVWDNVFAGTDKITIIFSTLRMRTEMVLETLVFLPFNHLTWLVAREVFIKISVVLHSLHSDISVKYHQLKGILKMFPRLPV
jgi:hypothetical protein